MSHSGFMDHLGKRSCCCYFAFSLWIHLEFFCLKKMGETDTKMGGKKYSGVPHWAKQSWERRQGVTVQISLLAFPIKSVHIQRPNFSKVESNWFESTCEVPLLESPYFIALDFFRFVKTVSFVSLAECETFWLAASFGGSNIFISIFIAFNGWTDKVRLFVNRALSSLHSDSSRRHSERKSKLCTNRQIYLEHWQVCKQ